MWASTTVFETRGVMREERRVWAPILLARTVPAHQITHAVENRGEELTYKQEGCLFFCNCNEGQKNSFIFSSPLATPRSFARPSPLSSSFDARTPPALLAREVHHKKMCRERV